MSACENGHWEIVEILLRHGAYADDQDEVRALLLLFNVLKER
jgi:ankyrin repeat protein